MTETPPRDTYHHGKLGEALIAASIEIIEEQGVEGLSIRAAAKRAGVSSGAPFRHFKSKSALLTAIAEQAMQRLFDAVIAATSELGDNDPLAALQMIGEAYLEWAIRNPTHFEIISSRVLIDFTSSASLQEQNEAIRIQMVALVEEARVLGQIAPETNVADLVLACRALVYGLSRMAIDGHFPEWHPHEAPQTGASHALRLFLDGISLQPPKKWHSCGCA